MFCSIGVADCSNAFAAGCAQDTGNFAGTYFCTGKIYSVVLTKCIVWHSMTHKNNFYVSSKTGDVTVSKECCDFHTVALGLLRSTSTRLRNEAINIDNFQVCSLQWATNQLKNV